MGSLTTSSVLVVDNCSSRRNQVRDQISDKVGDVVFSSPSFGSLDELNEPDHFISTMVVNISQLEMYPTTLVRAVYHKWPWISTLLFNGPSSAQLAVAAMKAGASDYLPEECKATDVVKAIETDLRRRPPIRSRESAFLGTVSEGKLIGNSESMKQVFKRFGTATDTPLNVLILGEPGTGKTFTAQAIHAQSTRGGAPFLLVDCRCAKPEDLRELFFGKNLSDYTDTDLSLTLRDLKGGTVVLNHVDEMDDPAQDAVAHAMETQDLTSRGRSQEERGRGVRFIGVTSSPSPPEDFRTDLYYRLGELPISLPPLRDRIDDILPLARHFLELHAGEGPDAEITFTADAQSALRNYSWPGNIRQLRNVVNRAARSAPDATIRRGDLLLPETPSSADQQSRSAIQGFHDTSQSQVSFPGSSRMGQASNHGGSPPVDPEENGSDSISFEGDDPASIPSMEKLKKQAVKRAYEMFDGDVDRASVALDIARSTVYRMLKRYDLRESDD